MKIGFTCGAFDLCHAGHMLAFKDAKNECDYLIVGLQTDPTIDRPQKNKPIQSLEERKIQLEAVKYIDEVVIYETEADLYAFLKNNISKINVRFLGEDWKGKRFTGDDLPIDIFFTERKHSYSSSELRERIKAQENTI